MELFLSPMVNEKNFDERYCYQLKLIIMRMYLFTIDTRETGFVSAIMSAGITYAIAQACSLGQLLECSCHRIQKSHHNSISGDYDWRGCSDNVEFGYRKSKDFLDRKLRNRDAKGVSLRHNYEAGRLVSTISNRSYQSYTLY